MVVWAGALWRAPRLGVDISAALSSVLTGLLPVGARPQRKAALTMQPAMAMTWESRL
ncbi:hypothetical protein JCM4020_10450 [Streptomyces coelicolor]|nr:hypothetical protein JCM4020_10450 [Streptomyces coelicolor]